MSNLNASSGAAAAAKEEEAAKFTHYLIITTHAVRGVCEEIEDVVAAASAFPWKSLPGFNHSLTLTPPAPNNIKEPLPLSSPAMSISVCNGVWPKL